MIIDVSNVENQAVEKHIVLLVVLKVEKLFVKEIILRLKLKVVGEDRKFINIWR